MASELSDWQRGLLRAPDSRMEAYYYSFERTGEPAIDAILSALAYAGKGWHSTEYWADEDSWGYGPFIQMTPEETIQAAAQEAANELARARAEAAAEALEEAAEAIGPWTLASETSTVLRERAAEMREKAGQQPTPTTTGDDA